MNDQKRKIWPWVLVLVLFILIGGGVLAFVYRENLENAWARKTKSPEEYFAWVCERQFGDGMGYFEAYEEATKNARDHRNIKISGETRFRLSDDLLGVIENSAGDSVGRLDAYNDIAVIWEAARKEDNLRAFQALQIKDKEYLISLEEMYDLDKSTVYVRSEQINEEYASVKLKDFLDADKIDKIEEYIDGVSGSVDMIPDVKTLKSIYGRYLHVLVTGITGISDKDEDITVNGTKKRCAALSFTMDGDQIKELSHALIDEMLDDDELEDMVLNVLERTLPDEDSEKIWEEAMDALEKAGDELDDMDIQGEGDITVYVNEKGRICGFEVDTDKDQFFAGAVRKGLDIYCEVSAFEGKDQMVELRGKGRVGKSGFTGDFMVASDASDLSFDFSLENVSPSGGTFRLDTTPLFDLAYKEADDPMVVSLLKSMEGELVITREIKNGNVDTYLALVDDDEEKLAILVKINTSEAPDIELPSGRSVNRMNDYLDVMDYFSDSDLSVLPDVAEKLGAPKDEVESLRREIDNAKW
ncbi:MAG: hypothetical protein IKI75_06985 [Lachnospiraceae bacterium]|nr:hypothetical protein [Lachnospiraceae bacterium]